MLKDMQAIIYYLTVDMRFSFKVFWSILLLSMSASFLIVLSFDTMMVFTPSLAIYIFVRLLDLSQRKKPSHIVLNSGQPGVSIRLAC